MPQRTILRPGRWSKLHGEDSGVSNVAVLYAIIGTSSWSSRMNMFREHLPLDEFSDRMIVGPLRTWRSQAVQNGGSAKLFNPKQLGINKSSFFAPDGVLARDRARRSRHLLLARIQRADHGARACSAENRSRPAPLRSVRCWEHVAHHR